MRDVTATKTVRAYVGLRIVQRNYEGYRMSDVVRPSDPIRWSGTITAVDDTRIYYASDRGPHSSWTKHLGPWQAIYAEATNHLVVW